MRKTTADRFWCKVNRDGPVPEGRPDLGPCWLWRLPGGIGGYGSFFFEGRTDLAHRVSYKLVNGSIPHGLIVDHLCRVRNCIRPTHLEAVTVKENNHRGRVWEGGAAAQREKTHCLCGNPYSGDNLRVCKDGKRACRTCERRYAAEHRARKLAQTPPAPRPRQQSCKNGHLYAESGFVSGGKQRCRACSRENLRALRARVKALEAPPIPPTHCKRGHEWNDINTYVSPGGQQACRACHRDKSREWYRARAVERRASNAA